MEMKINFCAGLKLLVGVALAISTATVFCQNVYNNEQVKTLAKQVGEEKATSCLLASRYMQKEYSSSKPSPPDPNGLDYGPIPKYPLKLGMVAQTLHATFERLATQFISVKKSNSLQDEFNAKPMDEVLDVYNSCMVETNKNPNLKMFFNYNFRQMYGNIR
jgi:hypothetical protein